MLMDGEGPVLLMDGEGPVLLMDGEGPVLLMDRPRVVCPARPARPVRAAVDRTLAASQAVPT